MAGHSSRPNELCSPCQDQKGTEGGAGGHQLVAASWQQWEAREREEAGPDEAGRWWRLN